MNVSFQTSDIYLTGRESTFSPLNLFLEKKFGALETSAFNYKTKQI